MQRLITKHRAGDDGFTLIELLIVIVILGILAAITVFAVGNMGKDSASAACKSDSKAVDVALEAYKAQNNSTYPLLMSSLVPSYLKTPPNGGTHYTITIGGTVATAGTIIVDDDPSTPAVVTGSCASVS
jgi:prepilin-type N-terminal cleavage/methylation domain-containing protein